MNRRQPPPQRQISAQRLARFCKAAKLWLLRGAGWLIAIAGISEPIERAIHQAIRPFTERMTWVVLTLIMLMAQTHLGPVSRKAGGPPRHARKHLKRSVFGARLRKLAKARDPRTLIMALLNLLEHAEKHAARLARRLRNGLARRLGGFSGDMYKGHVPFCSQKGYVSLSALRADTS